MNLSTFVLGLTVFIVGVLIVLSGLSAEYTVPVEHRWWIFEWTTTHTVAGNPYLIVVGGAMSLIGFIGMMVGIISKPSKEEKRKLTGNFIAKGLKEVGKLKKGSSVLLKVIKTLFGVLAVIILIGFIGLLAPAIFETIGGQVVKVVQRPELDISGKITRSITLERGAQIEVAYTIKNIGNAPAHSTKVRGVAYSLEGKFQGESTDYIGSLSVGEATGGKIIIDTEFLAGLGREYRVELYATCDGCTTASVTIYG